MPHIINYKKFLKSFLVHDAFIRVFASSKELRLKDSLKKFFSSYLLFFKNLET